uniref:Legume lectin domain-containing protein n=1 Tax=Daucus carota subsp. sativus TaxID=79200 RepID=A0A162B7Y9_DAUCS
MVYKHLPAGSSVFIKSLILLSTIHFAATLNFSYNSFTPDDPEIEHDGDAFTSSGDIHITKSLNGQSALSSVGRVTYKEPLHLWDKASGNLTDFTTRFTFVIDSINETWYGDGIAFFLVPNGNELPLNATGGGVFGLTNDSQPTNITANKFVAVEFDVFGNAWDPIESVDVNEGTEHVGVDINSVRSEKTVPWVNASSSITNGWTNEAQISYASSSKILSVSFRTGINGKDLHQSFNFVVDLRDHLPDWVSVGFSASTGSTFSYNRIRSWEFNSSLESGEDKAAQTHPAADVPSQTDPTAEGLIPSKSKNNKMGLVVGLAVGGFLLVCAAGIYVILKKKKKKKKKEREENQNPICVEDDFMDDEFEKGTGPKKFSYNALAVATKENERELVKWVWELYGREQILEAADPKLSGDYDEYQMQQLMIVGLWCAHPDWTIRPSINQVIQILNFNAPLPALPTKMPVATYSMPSNLSSLSLEYVTAQRNQTQSSGYSNDTDSSLSASAARLNNAR